MKLTQILNEAIAKRNETFLLKAAELTQEPIERLRKHVDNATDNPNIQAWILQDIIKNGLDIHSHDLEEIIKDYTALKSKLSDKNIYNYTITSLKQALEEIKNADIKGLPTTSLRIDPRDWPGIEVHRQKGPFTIYKITDPETLQEIGEGTSWCTKKSYPQGSRAEAYLTSHGPQYVITYNNRLLAQYSHNLKEFKNIDNQEIQDLKIFKNLDLLDLKNLDELIRDVPIIKLVQFIPDKRNKNIEAYIKKIMPKEISIYNTNLMSLLGTYIKKTNTPLTEFIPNPDYQTITLTAVYVGHRLPDLEHIILQTKQATYYYAATLQHAKINMANWEEGKARILEPEEEIKTLLKTARNYAERILYTTKPPTRWPQFEQLLLKSLKTLEGGDHEEAQIQAVLYAANTQMKRWPEIEPYLTRYYLIQKYMIDVTQKPYELKPEIVQNSYHTRTTYKILKAKEAIEKTTGTPIEYYTLASSLLYLQDREQETWVLDNLANHPTQLIHDVGPARLFLQIHDALTTLTQKEIDYQNLTIDQVLKKAEQVKFQDT